MNSSVSYQDYKSLWDTRYSAIEKIGNSSGFLFELNPDIGCKNSPRVPKVTNSSESWFAVLREVPRCSQKALKDIKSAGYGLVMIGDKVNSYEPQLSDDLAYILISQEYSEYLISNALSSLAQPDVLATVDANADVIVAIAAVSMFVLVAVALGVVILLTVKLHSQSRRGTVATPTFPPPEPVGTYWDRFTASIRLPLGPEQTKKLPNKKYERLGSLESCGICFEELKNGDEVRDLPCGHNNFHTSCLDQWLLTCNRSCPLCRHNVTKQRQAPEAHAEGELESNNALLSSGEEQNYGTVI